MISKILAAVLRQTNFNKLFVSMENITVYQNENDLS